MNPVPFPSRIAVPSLPVPRSRLTSLLLMLIAGLGFADHLWAGSILREVWEGVSGTAVSDLTSAPTFPNQPTSTNFVTDFFEAPTDVLENYGQRMHGYVVPPVSGNYTFWIATDDGGELWLSTNSDPTHKKLIASVASWTSSREWTKEVNQQSVPVALVAGTAYYIAALQKEGGGGDNLAVRWLRPDGVDEGPIPATHLLPYGTSFTPPTITQQPTNTVAMEGQLATFNVQVSNADLVNIRWQRNGVDLAGASGLILQYGPVTLSDQNAQFRAILSNSLGTTNSDLADLSVMPDTIQPTVVKVLNVGQTHLTITFSEAVDLASAGKIGNYTVDKGVTISSATLNADNRTVVLTTSPLAYGTTYTVSIVGVQDRAATSNTVASGTALAFAAVEYVPTDIGGALPSGGNLSVTGGVDVTGGGKTIAGTADQFQFSWQERSGDFDLQVRVASLTLPDPYARAGLMLRDSLEANARFGAIFAGSPQLGCFFQSRSLLAGPASLAAPTGGFPVNYPLTWLRLQRQGTTVSGYASLDAQTWRSLGSVTLSGLASKVYFGYAVDADTTNAVATARFRDLGPTQRSTTGPFTRTREAFGPSSRTTGMILSEIMYHPAPRTDGRNLEFIELANARSVPEDLTGWRISGAIDFEFPNGFQLAAGEFVVIAAAPDDIRSVYGITNVLGPYSGTLPGDSGTLRLRNNADALRLEVTYSDESPWPAAADGAGHSLVLSRPSYGEADPAAWSASELAGGSPGTMDPVVPDPLTDVMFNELLAHTDPPQVDFLELYNHSAKAVDLSGCWLSDDPATNRFRIAAGTILPAGGFISFTSDQLGFRLNAAGETLFFRNPGQSRVLNAVKFGAQENGVSFGRYPDGDPTIRRLSFPTMGTANAPWREKEVVINEIMYAPISGDADDQFVELFNRGAASVDLSGWKLTHAVSYTFPPNTFLGAHSYLVVGRNVAQLRSQHPSLTAANALGDFAGKLSNNGDRLVLTRPHDLVSTNAVGLLVTNLIHIAIADMTYGVGGRWGQWANGGGSSLELIDPNADPLRAANWADSDETTKAPWTTVSVTNRLDNGDSGSTPNRLQVGMQSAGECLIDNVEVFKDGSTNLLANGTFENGLTGWTPFGNHRTSALETTSGVEGSAALHVRGQEAGDTGVNSIRAVLGPGLTSGATGVIRAQVRWLRGWPEVLFRLRGNYLELPARLTVPTDLGTPGRPNSRLIPNAGPAIFDVTHFPPIPRASEPVLVTCRVSDPDGIGRVQLQYRVDPATTLLPFVMFDDGTGGDRVAGDGVYSATIPGQASGKIVAFRISATDNAANAGTSLFPADAPIRECLVRWDDPIPFGTFAHYHLWNTAATDKARGASISLDNTWRDATLVSGNLRVIYNAGFRDKGSPFHAGFGDIVVQVPEDDLLLGATERNFASTGNGGSEQTNIRSQLASWLAQQMGIPYLHAQYVRLYRNGGLFRSISEDLEVPNRSYARRWFPQDGRGDLFKIAVWFEFKDDNLSFNANGATLQKFTTTGNEPKLARYRWNWDRRPDEGTANNYTNIFDLVDAANDTSARYTPRLLELADMEEWMRVFAYHRIMGNWDSWTYNVGQNMYAFKQPGATWKLIPWDIDFTFGLGDGASSPLGGGSFGGNSQDPIANKFYNTPEFRRMLWRAYQDAVAGPLLTNQYSPQIAARRSILLKNQVTDSTDPRPISTYIEQRRAYIQRQLTANDAKQLAITSNGGNDFESASPTTTLTGIAPFAVAAIEINGVPYPLNWTSQTNFQVITPLPLATNKLILVGKDRNGQPVPGASNSVTVTYRGAIPQVKDFVSLTEVQYNPATAGTSFVELFNRSTSVPFDLSGFRLTGVNYVFPGGAIIQPGSYLLLVKDKAAFSKAYGATIPVFDAFPGSLENDGERVALINPGNTSGEDELISDVRYENRLPWPPQAAGFGPSLQLVDPAQDTYRAGNWAATATNDVNRATPGRANATAQTLAPFPLLWLNEVQPNNPGGFTDNAGQADPWIELYNSGSTTVDLSAYYLSDDFTNLTRWRFPAGSSMAAGQFLVIWADGQTAQSTAVALHTSFRLSSTNGALALSRLQGSPAAPAVMDYINYPAISEGRSFGSIPDGEPRQRQLLQTVTPGAANNPTWPKLQVTLNELMAANTKTLLDPATAQYEDWFELYNGGPNWVDLSGYVLSDGLTYGTRFVIPPETVVSAGSFLFCWADNQPGANLLSGNALLHTNFKLAKSGGQLALFDPSGQRVDGLEYGAQSNDVSVGRYPDGADLPLLALDQPTPGTANNLAGGNRPPVFSSIPGQSVAEGILLQFNVSATDPDAGQQVSYSLAPDAPANAMIDPQSGLFRWTPPETAGPGNFLVMVRATDNGAPPRTSTAQVAISVSEVNGVPQFLPVGTQTVQQGDTLTVALQAADADTPSNALAYQLAPGAPAGMALDPQSGVLTWTPSAFQALGEYPVQVTVTDNGTPPLTGSAVFSVLVQPGPKPPVITNILPQTVNELTAWQLAVQAIDPETPPSSLTYSLDIAPDGAQIGADTGLITWTPTESQGPTNAVFVVRVTRSTPPNRGATATFSVRVDEVNQRPTLGPLTDQVAFLGQPFSLSIAARDPDFPGNRLTFGLEPGAPAGLTINSENGVLSWTPAANQVPSTNRVSVRVTDDGTPPLSETQSFTVIGKRESPWKFVSASGTASSSTLYIYLSGTSDVYLDDLMLVAGNEPGVGTNTLVNGNFEESLAIGWTVSPNLSASTVQSARTHGGQGALHVIASSAGTTRASAIYQDISPTLESGAPYTVSFWYLPGTNNTTLTVRLSGNGITSATQITAPTNTPPVLAPTRSEQGLPTFSWSAQVGRTYRVEFKDTLRDPQWQTYSEFQADMTQASFADQSGRTTPQRYYRIVLLP